MDDSERDDISLAQGGDGAAFERLIRRYEAAIARQLWRFTRDRTALEELVQDVFVQAFYSLPRFAHRQPLSHWLSRITTRAGYRFWQRERAARSVEPLERAAFVTERVRDNPSAAAELLHGLFARLKPPERLVLTLLHLEQCTTEEIAARIGWPRAVVKMRAMRARRRLKEIAADLGLGAIDV